ncbi:cyclic AMP-dependent transcription factor ATF-2 [Schistocerca nitens]|uniref:cyclic AMP-dependent transcription factor ATF-2 n=1 Tax=Schistocerca nitens TaxID=7011 RepID=UPI00211901ED|nr:cyclic AMP-dependent transcription factor ATF-2 [Schistocerca nitens]
MMEESEKPFACSAEGCLMRFTNEDHLTVHKKKHDMVLNLGSAQKSNLFSADQTPTPTRFIRNCEEVGLFQDLQNVNPFEETFRKAFEASKAGISMPEVDPLSVTAGGDDTLHTPHVFPNIIEDSESIPSLLSTESLASESSKRSPVRQDLVHFIKNSSVTEEEFKGKDNLHNSVASDCLGKENPEQLQGENLMQLEDDSLNQQNETGGLQVLLKTSDDKLVHLSLEQFAQLSGSQLMIPIVTSVTSGASATSNEDNSQSVDMPTCVPTVCKPVAPTDGSALVKMKLKQTLTNNNKVSTTSTPGQSSSEQADHTAPPAESRAPCSTHSRTRKSSSQCDDDEKRKKFLERNRAAAMRCREKRKSWIKDLEKRADILQTSNDQLQAEVKSLRAELATLKALLLQHKNCSVSVAMMQNAHVTAVEADSTNTTTVHQTTAVSRISISHQPATNKPIVATKILLSPPSNEPRHIILLNRPPVKRNVGNATPPIKKKVCAGAVKQNVSGTNNQVLQQAYLISSTSADAVQVAQGNISNESLVPAISVANVPTVPEIIPAVLKDSTVPSTDCNLELSETNQQLVSLSLISQSEGHFPALVVPGVALKSTCDTVCDTGLNSSQVVEHMIDIDPSMVSVETHQEPNSSVERDHSEDSDIEVVYDSSSKDVS